MNDQEAFAIAIEEAVQSYNEGGVPVRIFPVFKYPATGNQAQHFPHVIADSVVDRSSLNLTRWQTLG